jgi:hypothetical protein
VREDRTQPIAHADFAGQAASILTLLAISFVVINARAGVAAEILASALGIAVVGAAMFVLVQRYARRPMLALVRCDRRAFNASILTVGAVNFAWYGIMLVATLLMQRVMKLDPYVVGLYLTPASGAFFVANAYSTALVQRIGMGAAVAASFALAALGVGSLALLHLAPAPWYIAAALTIASAGWGLISTPASSLGMAAVDTADHGFASAMLVLSRTLFGVFGVAVLGTLLDSYLVNLETFTQGTFLHGVRLASALCVVVMVVCGCAVLVLLGRGRSGRNADLPIA